jgi:hypothetical protein
VTVAAYLLIFMFVATALSILWRPRRPPPPQHLSDSAGSAQFAAARRDEEARGRR